MTQEHLASTDRCIAASRVMLLNAIRELQQGIEPPLFTRDAAKNPEIRLVSTGIQVPPGVDWRTHVRGRFVATPV